MNINKKHKLLSKFLTLLMSAFLMLSMTLTAFAAAPEIDGNAGNKQAGAAVNTFARGMDLQTVYLDYSKMHAWVQPSNITGSGLTANGGSINYSGSNLPATGKTDFTGYSWEYVYKDAAVYPDGSTADVTVKCDLHTIYTASLDSTGNSGNLLPEGTGGNFDGQIRLWGGSTQNYPTGDVYTSGRCRSFKAFITTTVSVAPSSTSGGGTYIIPISGDNAYKGNGAAWKPLYLYNPLNDDLRIRQEEVTYSGTKYMASNHDLMFYDDQNTVAGKALNKSGVDDSYIYGFAIEGSAAGTTIDFGITGGYSGGNQGNTIKHQMGDLQHRIWSGSGPHGKIETGKSGTGTDLAGGSFTGNVPSGFPATNTATQNLMRYVVPDAKEKVTYTMTPDKGYTMDTLVVDGTTYTVPKIPAGASIATTDGNGTLTYLGGGKFTFEFTNANTKDHEIYVTWRKATADIIVNKAWNDNSKASGVNANVKLTWGSNSDSKAVPTSDGQVHKWEDMDVFEYDANGDAGDPITYKLEEDPDPVSGDYAKGVWSGTDKAGNAADVGFNLTDDSKENKAREKDDPFTATVTNTLKKDVEITKKWNDQDNKYNTRPSDVAGMFKLYNAADDTEVTGITPTATEGTNEHTIKWAGLPAFDASGTELKYYAVETDVPAGYISDPSDGKIAEDGVIENVLETKNVSITKTWDDEDNKANKRPAANAMTSSFTLYNDQAMTSAVSAIPSVTDNEDNTYTVKWTDLPEKNAGGSITYYAKETAVPSEYEITGGADGVSENGNITNKFTIQPPTGEDDKSYGGKGEPQEGKPEFTKGTGNIPTTGAYTLLDGDTPVDELTIPGEGRYTIDKNTGVVTFTPEPDFVDPGTGVTVQVTDEFGEKATAEYTPTVVNNTQTVSKEQKINYHYSDGSPVLDSEGNPLVRTRSAEYTREGKVDPKTGEITSWDPWTPVKFDNIDSPGIEGYTPDKATVTGGSFTPDNWPADVDVIYTKESPVPPKPDDPTPPDDPADDPADDYPDVNPTDDDTSAGSTGVRTGDAANVIVWIVILAAVIAAVTYLIIRRRTNE